MSLKVEFTTEELHEAKAMRAKGVAWKKIGPVFGVGGETIRKALDPEFVVRARGWDKIKEARRKMLDGEITRSGVFMQRPLVDQPQPTTPGQFYFGDPLPGRSVLDQRLGVSR
jgi:hypothetical protein